MSCLSDIFLALLLALLLGRAVRVEVVELAAGEHLVVGPLAVLSLVGSLDSLANTLAGKLNSLPRALRPPFFRGRPLVRGVDNYLNSGGKHQRTRLIAPEAAKPGHSSAEVRGAFGLNVTYIT